MKIISTTKAPRASKVYSQAVLVDKFLYVAGQIGLIPETNMLETTFELQVKRSLNNLFEIVKEAGGQKTSIIKCNLYLCDMSKFAEVNKIYGEFFEGHKPARATVEVKGLPLGASFEIECVAYIV